jgi:hypothetical protein
LWFSDNFRIDVLTFWHGLWVLVTCCLLFVACYSKIMVSISLCLFNFFFYHGFSILHECNSPFLPFSSSPFHFLNT